MVDLQLKRLLKNEPVLLMQIELTSDALTLTGELNHHTVPDAAKEISRLFKEGTISKIDLGELTMIDSAGVAFLDEMHLKLSEDSKQQIFQKIPPKIQEIGRASCRERV